MKPSVIRSSSSRSRMFRRGAETKATAGQEQPHPLLLSPSTKGTSQWLSGKESACNSGDPGGLGSIPGSGRFPGERNDNPLQYSCLENPMDRGTWPAIVCEVAQSQAQLKQLSTAQHSTALSYLTLIALRVGCGITEDRGQREEPNCKAGTSSPRICFF